MKWNQAKNFMIGFFLVVNLFLAALINQETYSRTFGNEREALIVALLAQNNVYLMDELPQARDMRMLRLSGEGREIEELLAVFGMEGAEHIGGAGRDEFVAGDARLVVLDNDVFYISGIGQSGMPTLEAARAVADEFIAAFYPDFIFDPYSTREARRGGLRLFYRQEFQNYTIHSNFIELLIMGEDELVIEEVDMHFNEPLGFSYTMRDLVAVDEMLFTFVRFSPARAEPTNIVLMDLVYFHNSQASEYAEPFFRIFMENQDVPFLIGGYTNVMQ